MIIYPIPSRESLGLAETDSPAFTDLTISSPSNIYALSHDSFADYAANKHIDWTNTASNFSTSGTLGAGAGTLTSLICPTIGVSGDTDLLGLAANALTVNGTLGAGAITGTSLNISGDADIRGAQFRGWGDGTRLLFSTAGPSYIGGTDVVWLGYTAAPGQWFLGTAIGDIAFRAANTKKLHIGISDGAGTSYPKMTFSSAGIAINPSDSIITPTNAMSFALDKWIDFGAATQRVGSDDENYLDLQAATGIRANAGLTATGFVTTGNIGDGTYTNTVAQLATASINFVIDGGGSAITTGIKGYIEVPFACTIKQVTLLADQSGAIKIDIWKCSYADYDVSTHPVDADTITGANEPEIAASGVKDQDATLTGWTVAIAAGDILAFNVDSITTIERCTLSLKVIKDNA